MTIAVFLSPSDDSKRAETPALGFFRPQIAGANASQLWGNSDG